MKKILIIWLLTILLNSCANDNTKKDVTFNTWTVIETGSWIIIEKTKEEIEAEKRKIKKEKIETLRKKLSLRWLILKWDLNLEDKEYTSALIKFLQINKKIPNDKNTIQKLWDVYFHLKKFKQAYSYFSQVKDYSKLDKDKVSLSLISSVTLNKENIVYINKELDSLWLNEDQLFYYKNAISCTEDFSLCKKKFSDYFILQKEKELEKTWTWEIEKKEIFQPLYNIETALKNYENFQVDSLSYKWALVSWAFFENWLYPIAIATSKKLLLEKKKYKPLLKIVAKSYFELWNYIEAKVYLVKYNKLVKVDPEASYFLWIIYEKLREYVLSTIHFRKALRTWYKNTLDVNRRILINYYEIWEIDKMLKSFDTIINENKDDITINDYDLAIYYNIVNEKMENAKKYTKEAIELYPESEIFNWYYSWILMEEINSQPEVKIINSWTGEILEEINLYEEADTYINKALKINTKNPMITLVKWKIEMSKWEIKKAFIYFKKTVALDKKWDYWKIAKQELEGIIINR